MKLLLLPGADGTGILFEPFIQCIDRYNATSGTKIEPTIINLNEDSRGNVLNQKLSAQAEYIEQHYSLGSTVSRLNDKRDKVVITNDPWVIVAESYSGLLAYELLKQGKLNVSHVVFVASFLRPPSKLSAIGPKINPVWFTKTLNLTPKSFWGRLVFGRWQTPYLCHLFLLALQQTPHKLLQQRLNIIANADVSDKTIDVPCLYLQPSQDSLVSSHNIKLFKKVFINFESVVIESTHFLLQTNPDTALNVLTEYLEL